MPEHRAEPPAGATAVAAAEPEPAGEGAGSGGPAGGIRTWWLVAPAFVLGLFAGAILLGLLREDPPAVPASAAEYPADSEAAGQGPSGEDEEPGASAEFAVNAACLRVVNGTRDLVDVIGDLGTAAADLDIAGLDQGIRELQPLERRLREDLDGCESETTLPGGREPEDPDAPESADPSGEDGSEEPDGSPTTTAPPD
ncbi:hypothetical protein [Blastococcus xanthinilyticus]|uniref:Uncharacterized protein n=1 Tax=Blastococcus xanthinilyticus TaxID=1564164 RepID=A0A5S5D0J6_9ACTN|nr:hypothetical protein [Blastococcus xanthinilyticus]TYP89563.1 hypothetical protein BD833_10236 [Blastococcus xanthinilyticus]